MDKNDILNKVKTGASKVADAAKDVYDAAAPKVKELSSDAVEFASTKAIPAVRDVADKVNDKAPEIIEKAKDIEKDLAVKAKEIGQEVERAIYKPITLEDLSDVLFEVPNLIQIVADNTYRDKESFKDAIGFKTEYGNATVLNLYIDCINKTNFIFQPMIAEDLYFYDAYNPNQYVALNNYFDYAKKMRVDELVRVAHDLGAKSCEIRFKEERKVFVAKHTKGKANAKIVKADYDENKQEAEFTNVEVADTSKFAGNSNPMVPELLYFKNEDSINSLIDMRIKAVNPIQVKTYKIRYNNTSSLKKSDAVQIDGVLKRMKIGANASIASEAEREERTVLEYTIEF